MKTRVVPGPVNLPVQATDRRLVLPIVFRERRPRLADPGADGIGGYTVLFGQFRRRNQILHALANYFVFLLWSQVLS